MHTGEFVAARSVLRLVVALCVVMTIATIPASASIVWNWHYSGAGVRAGGTFTTTEKPNAGGGYLITAITGTRNGHAITALQAPGSSIPGNEPFLVDDLVFPGPGPQLTSGGFGFSTADGSYSNPFYADFLSPPGYLEFFSTPPTHTEPPIGFSAAPVAVPEPATAVLVLAAGLSLCGIRQRRRGLR